MALQLGLRVGLLASCSFAFRLPPQAPPMDALRGLFGTPSGIPEIREGHGDWRAFGRISSERWNEFIEEADGSFKTFQKQGAPLAALEKDIVFVPLREGAAYGFTPQLAALGTSQDIKYTLAELAPEANRNQTINVFSLPTPLESNAAVRLRYASSCFNSSFASPGIVEVFSAVYDFGYPPFFMLAMDHKWNCRCWSEEPSAQELPFHLTVDCGPMPLADIWAKMMWLSRFVPNWLQNVAAGYRNEYYKSFPKHRLRGAAYFGGSPPNQAEEELQTIGQNLWLLQKKLVGPFSSSSFSQSGAMY